MKRTKDYNYIKYKRPYNTWVHLKARCRNPRDKYYKDYGGRGITYDPRWNSFNAFWEDMKDGYQDNLSIDRIDNNGDYCKENCRWATMKEQQANKRPSKTTAILITHNGMTKNLTEWAEYLGVSRGTPHWRLKHRGTIF